MSITQTIVTFPEIALATRDAHKLRGYFGEVFREKSPLLHNHYADGSHRYAYPLVQYKVIDQVPCLVGFNEGADLLVGLFLKIRWLKIDGKEYPILGKNITQQQHTLNVDNELFRYRFKTLWMALNQKNYDRYTHEDAQEKQAFLDKTLRNNILSFYKGVGYWTKEKIMAKVDVTEKTTQFKNRQMLAFSGDFVTNAFIPRLSGIGKSVSRGFGSVEPVK